MSQTFRLGLFMVAALAVLAAGVFLIGSRESLFQSTYSIRSDFQNVAGLADGADVRVGGLHQGTVKHIQIPNRPDGKVVVTMDLDKATRPVLNKGSIASIKSDGLVGDKYVEISFGSEGAPPLKDGDTIASQPPLDISNLVKKADQLLDTAQGAVTDLGGTASNLQSISAKINQGKGTVGELINNKTIYEKATAGATALNEDMEALKHNFLLRGFFKNRGYEDAADLTKHAISRLPASEPVKAFDFEGKKLFNQQAKLEDHKALKDVGDYLEANKFGLAVIVDAVGMKGETGQDRVLSEGRAAAVLDYLAKNFRLDDTRIKTLALGKTDGAGDIGNLEILVYPQAVSEGATKSNQASKETK